MMQKVMPNKWTGGAHCCNWQYYNYICLCNYPTVAILLKSHVLGDDTHSHPHHQQPNLIESLSQLIDLFSGYFHFNIHPATPPPRLSNHSNRGIPSGAFNLLDTSPPPQLLLLLLLRPNEFPQVIYSISSHAKALLPLATPPTTLQFESISNTTVKSITLAPQINPQIQMQQNVSFSFSPSPISTHSWLF